MATVSPRAASHALLASLAPALPWLAGLAGVIASLLFYRAFHRQFAADARRQTELAARGAAADLGSHLDDRVLTLVRMAQRVELGPRSLRPWRADARLQLTQYRDLVTLAVLDTSGRQYARLDRAGVPEGRLVAGVPDTLPALVRQAQREAGPVAITVADESGGGEPDLMIVAPLLLPSARPGSLVAVWHLNPVMRLVDATLSRDFVLRVGEGGHTVYRSPAAPDSGGAESRIDLRRPYGAWQVQAVPAANSLSGRSARRLTTLMLTSGLAGSGLLAVTLQSRRRTRQVRDRVRQAAAQLGREVDDRRRAQQSLVAAQQRLREVINALPVGVWLLSADGVTIRGNPAAARIWGQPDFLGPGGVHRFRTTDPATGAEISGSEWIVARAVRSGAPGDPETLLVQFPDGRRRVIMSSIAPLAGPGGGSPGGFVLVSDDITDRYALELQLQQARRLESIGRLAGGVAHDFNNLLTVILTGTDLLLGDSGLPQAARNEVAEVRLAAQRAASLTAQLLAFGRQQVMRPEPLDANEIVRGTLGMLSRLIGEHIVVRTILDPALAPVLMDRSQLEQVLLNLVLNARDAMPGGGVLTIESSNVTLDADYSVRHAEAAMGPHVLLSIADSGAGMDEETRRHLFEPFFTTKERGKGTGLGLATVYGIVRQSGGRIWVYSEPGHGSVFKLYLPCAATPSAPAPSEGPSPEPERGTETVLLVEDDASVRSATGRMLRRFGYQVHEAAGREDALRLVHGGLQPDLLMTDVMLTDTTGPDVALALRAVVPGLRVLFTSGYTANTVVRDQWEPGAFLPKPYTAADLQAAIRRVLASPRPAV